MNLKIINYSNSNQNSTILKKFIFPNGISGEVFFKENNFSILFKQLNEKIMSFSFDEIFNINIVPYDETWQTLDNSGHKYKIHQVDIKTDSEEGSLLYLETLAEFKKRNQKDNCFSCINDYATIQIHFEKSKCFCNILIKEPKSLIAKLVTLDIRFKNLSRKHSFSTKDIATYFNIPLATIYRFEKSKDWRRTVFEILKDKYENR